MTQSAAIFLQLLEANDAMTAHHIEDPSLNVRRLNCRCACDVREASEQVCVFCEASLVRN